MLPKFTSAFKVEEEEEDGKESRNSSRSTFGGHASSKNKGTVVVAVGLKILVVQKKSSQGKSNIVIKPALIKQQHSSSSSKSSPTDPQLPAAAGCTKSNQYSCFLKSCFLCNKNLSLDKDVYMYRGDQGFCSIECRNRQIVLDDMRELENSTKKMVAYYRNCTKSDRRETQILLQELRHRHHKSHEHDNKHQKIHWTIIS
ncbi:hypothetical protein ACOSQ2_020208 [Xanthoceras sorbifolium]